LLQEYFFGDYGKIGLVLGQGFFAVQEATDDENFFAEFNDYELDGILDKKVYHLIDVTLLDDASFTELVLAILPRS
jgi:5-methylcytosine-specific restriction protein B